MGELLKARLQKIVNGIIRSDSSISKEVIEDYKEMIVDSCCEIFSALADMYEDEDEMKKRIEEFIRDHSLSNPKASTRGFDTDSYMIAAVPIILPIEAIAVVDGMDDSTLPLLVSQISGWLIRTIMLLKGAETLEDKYLEASGAKLAEHLKDKGWVA